MGLARNDTLINKLPKYTHVTHGRLHVLHGTKYWTLNALQTQRQRCWPSPMVFIGSLFPVVNTFPLGSGRVKKGQRVKKGKRVKKGQRVKKVHRYL